MGKEYARLPEKLRFILWPSARLAFIFLAGYGLLDGALLYWLPPFDPPADFWKFLGPGIIATVLVVWLSWPRLRLLHGIEDKGRAIAPTFLSMTAVAIITLGTSHLHEYLRASLGRLEILDSPAVLLHRPSLGTYYCFRHKYQTARYAGVEWQNYVVEKSHTLIFNLYVATPLLASPADTVLPMAGWQGLHYSAEVSSNASKTEKEAAYQAFLKRTMAQFGTEDFSAPAGYYERIPNTSERAAYLRAARSAARRLPDTGVPLLLLQPGQVSLVTLQREALGKLAGWLSAGAGLFFITLFFAKLPVARAQAFRP